MRLRRIWPLLVAPFFAAAPPAVEAAFPNVTTSDLTTDTTDGTTIVCDISSSGTNDLTLIFVARDNTNTVTWENATELWDDRNLAVGYIMPGVSKASTETVTATGSTQGFCRAFVISGASTSSAPELAGNSTVFNNHPDPPNLAPAGGSDDYLWFIGAALDGGDAAGVSSYPTNYGAGNEHFEDGGVNSADLITDWRTNTAASENPGQITLDASASHDEVTVAVYPAGVTAPSISTGLDCNNSLDSDGFDCTVTVDQDSTGYWVACRENETAPTDEQVKAGNCTGDAAALEDHSASLTASMEATQAFTGLSARIAYDVYFIASNAGGDSSQSSDVDAPRGANTGFQIVQLASLSGTGVNWPSVANQSIYDLQDDETYWGGSTVIAANDWIEIATETANGIATTGDPTDCLVSQETDGDIVISNCPEAPDSIAVNQVQDASTGDLFAAASGTTPDQYEGSPDALYFNNDPPICDTDPDSEDVSVQTGAAFNRDLNLDATDNELGQLYAFLKTGTWPTGLSLGGTGNMTLSGTVADMDEDESGVPVTLAFYDSAGNECEVDRTLWPLDTWAIPNFIGSEHVSALAIAAGPPAFMDVPDPANDPIFGCQRKVSGSDIGDGEIYSQDPAPSTEVEIGDTLDVGVNLNSICRLFQERR